MVSFVIFDLSLSAINTNNCDDLRWSYKDISHICRHWSWLLLGDICNNFNVLLKFTASLEISFTVINFH